MNYSNKFKQKCENCMYWSAFDAQYDDKTIWAKCLSVHSPFSDQDTADDDSCVCFEFGPPIDGI